MIEQWRELKETIIDLRDNDGIGTQQEVCKFLVNLMDVLEKQVQWPKDDYNGIMEYIDERLPEESCEDAISRQAAIEEIPFVHQKHEWETCFECPLSHGCPKIKGCTNEQAIEYASQIPNDCPLSAQPEIKTDGDIISRQAAIEIIKNYCENGCDIAEDNWCPSCQREKFVELLKALPSAQSENCEGCKHLDKWENEIEYGYPSPCTRCKKRVEDHYER